MVSRRGLLFFVIAGAVVVGDQVSKAAVRADMAIGESLPVIDGVFWLTHVENTGAAFGMLRGQQWLLIATAAAMLAVVAYVMVQLRPLDSWVHWALALVSGGAIGNLIDRVLTGAVTDFFDLGWFPVFNVADIALDVGVVVLVVLLLFKGEHALVGQSAHHAGQSLDTPHTDREVCTADARSQDA